MRITLLHKTNKIENAHIYALLKHKCIQLIGAFLMHKLISSADKYILINCFAY